MLSKICQAFFHAALYILQLVISFQLFAAYTRLTGIEKMLPYMFFGSTIITTFPFLCPEAT